MSPFPSDRTCPIWCSTPSPPKIYRYSDVALGAKVTLRNLVIVHLTSSANGINFAQGATLTHTYTKSSRYLSGGTYNFNAQLNFFKTTTVAAGVGTLNTNYTTLVIAKVQ